MNVNGRKGGLALLWKAGWEVDIQSFSLNHIDSLVKVKGEDKIRVTVFYEHLELQLRS